MLDQRLQTLAQVLVQQSLAVQPGEKVHLELAGELGLPLARACWQELVLAGALPHLSFADEQNSEFFFSQAGKKQLAAKPELAFYHARFFDKNLRIIAPENVANLAQIKNEILIARSRLMSPVKDLIMTKPWVMTYYPTPALAQAAKMSLRELENYVFAACNRDWRTMSALMRRLAKKVTNQKLHLVGVKTDLWLETKGRTWEIDDWHCNIPGGEIFTSPILDSTEGRIYFEYPVTRHGKTISEIELEFKKGVVTKARAATHEDFLHELLHTDAGANLVGEIAFGLNPGCDRYLDETLFDEKMAGTMHLALGAGFEECGAPTNESALHLDLVKEFKTPGSEVWAGATLIMKAGVLQI
jgi:aminopeptidase